MHPSLLVNVLSFWLGKIPGIMPMEMQSSKEMPKPRGRSREVPGGTNLSLLPVKVAPFLRDIHVNQTHGG